jgi:competence protein ComEC
MVAALVEALARARHWSRRARVMATMTTIVAYVVVSGAGAAALRSSVMIGAGLLLDRDGRRPHSFALLGVCAALLLAIEPAVATDVGFQLSFLGTAGILVLAAPIASHLPGPRLLAEPFAVTIAAQLATAPVTAGTFGVLSMVGPMANALVLPLLPGIIITGGLGALFGGLVPALGWLPLQLAGLGVRGLLAIAQGAAAIPFAAVHLQLWPSTWTVAALLTASAGAVAWFANERWLLFRARSVTVAAVAAALAATATLTLASVATPASFRLTVLDVGNGVAVLITPPGGGAILVDGGSDGPGLITALGRAMSPLDRHLDAVVLTGTDRATAAALPSLIGRYDVGTMVVSQPAPPALATTLGQLAGTGTRVVVAGSVPWTMGGLGLRCIPTGPASSAPCVLQVSDGRATAMITGNLPQASQDELAAVARSQLRSDLLVAPTTTAPSTALVGVVRPQLVAVPARRVPPGVNGLGLDVAVTGRDSDLVYSAIEGGGFASDLG